MRSRTPNSGPDSVGSAPTTPIARPSHSQEAQIVAEEIGRLLGTPWVNRHGVEAPLTAQDFMVVAPYNDQVALLRATLDALTIDEGRTRRDGRQIPGSGSGRRVLHHDHILQRLHAPQCRVPLLTQPPERGGESCTVPRLPGLHGGPAEQSSTIHRGDAAHLDAVFVCGVLRSLSNGSAKTTTAKRASADQSA